jgi:hypothetical protein
MKALKQTRVLRINKESMTPVRGNPLATIVACFLDLDSPEDAIQIQEHYDSGEATWVLVLSYWLEERGWDWGIQGDHKYDGSYYITYGVSPRGETHACIYQNGVLHHDPHESGDGLMEESHFEYIRRNKRRKFEVLN